MQRPPDLEALVTRVQEFMAPYAGRVEYGNLRMRISDWDCGDGDPVTNLALVYETPGGSTDQINVTYHHVSRVFGIIDADCGEHTTPDAEVVMSSVEPRVVSIPQKRAETLQAEIRRQIDSGSNTAGLFAHLNRIIQSEFKGGCITLQEFKDAMTYAVHYMKEGSAARS